MSARTDLANAIRAGVPTTWTVYPYPGEPDAVSRPQIYVYQSEIKPAALAPVGHFEITLKIHILVSHDLDPLARENVLDEALARVLDVLDMDTRLTWASAERAATNGFHSYEITATAVGKKDA